MTATPAQRKPTISTHPIVALTGFMGSGKTSTGQALADLLGWALVDLDSAIEAKEGTTIRNLFEKRGEAVFRALEHTTLRRCLDNCVGPTVIALGGGAFAQTDNADLLRDRRVRTVFLQTPVEEMLQRCCVGESSSPENTRPLAVDPEAFRTLYERRLPQYRFAEVTVHTAGKSIAEVANEIAARLGLEPSR